MAPVRSHRWSMHVGFHCLFFDDGADNAVVEPDQQVGFVGTQAGSVSVYTGLAHGRVDVRIEVFDDPPAGPPGLAEWAEWAEVSVPPGIEPSFRLHATSGQVSDEHLVGKPSGAAIRIRVLANGRSANWDAGEPNQPEEYLIQFWPEHSFRKGRSSRAGLAPAGLDTPGWSAPPHPNQEQPQGDPGGSQGDSGLPRSPDFLAALAAARSEAERSTSVDQPQRAAD